MKKLILVSILLFTVGCIPTKQQINTLTNDVSNLMVKIDNYQEKFAEEVDRVQDDILVVNEAVKEKADESFVEQLEAGIEASKPFNPYADEMNAALGLITVIGGIFVKGKIDEKNRVNAKYSAAKAGMDKFKNENPDKAKELYNDVGEARKAKKVV